MVQIREKGLVQIRKAPRDQRRGRGRGSGRVKMPVLAARHDEGDHCDLFLRQGLTAQGSLVFNSLR